MKKLKNWFYNLKIKAKLFVLLVITVLNFLVFFAFTTFFSDTTRTFIWTVDVERLHTQYFEMGLETFFIYLYNDDTAYYNDAIKSIEKANRFTSLMVNIDSLVANTTKTELEDIYWDYYKEPLHFDRSATDLFAERTRIFVMLNFSIMAEAYALAAEGHQTGNNIIHLFEEYQTTKSPEIIEQIRKESDTIRKFYSKFSSKITDATNFGMQVQFIISMVILLILIIITLFSINWFSSYLYNQLKILVDGSQKLAEGDLKIEIRKPSNDEIGWLFDAFNVILINMKETVSYANKISEGNFELQIEPRSKKDELSIALNLMANSLNESKIKHETEAWQSQGLNILNDKISGDLTLETFTINSIYFLLNYFSALSGSFYTSINNTLELQYSSAMDSDKLKKTIPFGSGVIGQAVEVDSIIHLKNLKDKDYITFTSTVKIEPRELLIIPLHYNNEVLGLIELTTVNEFNEQLVEFINSIKSIISLGLHVTISRHKLKDLLETTQQQAEELEVQQEELRESNAELEEQTRLLRENEVELQAQQEELRVTNEELEEKTHDLEIQRNEVIKNSTELEKAKTVVEQKAREVEIASKYKSEFLANMSHELRTPLNSLLILSKDLCDNNGKNLTDNQVESAQIINDSGNELLALINDILDLSKIESGKMVVNPEYLTLEEIENDIKLMFSHMAEKKKLFFNTQIVSISNYTLFTDHQKVNQILKNLISNAIKFTAEGGITVTFTINEDSKETLCVAVSDTGIGIPDGKQIEIFEAFQQVDGGISRTYGGTGLGLSISRELSKLLNGKITLSSTYGKGSIFTICIPLNYSETDSDYTEIIENNKNITNSIKNLPLKKIESEEAITEQNDEIIFIDDDRYSLSKDDKIILIIEDDLVLAKDLKNKCYDAGFKCLVSGNGENGLYLTEKYHPDAILLDIMLPGIDGYKVLDILKQNPETRHIPVQMMSSLENEIDILKKGAIGFISKPLSKESITNTLDKISSHINKNVKDLLIVEDDEINSIMISKLLGGKDINLSLTDSGTEALKMLKENTYDCVVLDLGLKDMSGLDLVREINTSCKKKLPPIIVYTGKELTKEETKELQRYTQSIIIKGVKSDGRLLDETALFLHRVVDDMSESKKQIIKKLHNQEAVFDNKTVLIVDDDMRNVFALTKLLEDRNLKVIEAENGKVALDKLSENNNIDIILMDVMMPVMDGLTATKEIRKLNKTREIPIIVLTAKAMKEDRLNALAAGANDYLSKPVDTEKLLSLMRVWLYN
ncbi:MAG: response regulator [Bacteroidota bacterium]